MKFFCAYVVECLPPKKFRNLLRYLFVENINIDREEQRLGMKFRYFRMFVKTRNIILLTLRPMNPLGTEKQAGLECFLKDALPSVDAQYFQRVQSSHALSLRGGPNPVSADLSKDHRVHPNYLDQIQSFPGQSASSQTLPKTNHQTSHSNQGTRYRINNDNIATNNHS